MIQLNPIVVQFVIITIIQGVRERKMDEKNGSPNILCFHDTNTLNHQGNYESMANL